jgi:hypothetical protein
VPAWKNRSALRPGPGSPERVSRDALVDHALALPDDPFFSPRFGLEAADLGRVGIRDCHFDPEVASGQADDRIDGFRVWMCSHPIYMGIPGPIFSRIGTTAALTGKSLGPNLGIR